MEYVRDDLARARWSGSFSVESGQNYDVGSSGYGKEDSGAGALTGFSQTGGRGLDNYFTYGNIRDQFVIQCDMIQTTDRCSFGVGTGNSIDMGNKGFSVFFRPDGSALGIGIYVNKKETPLIIDSLAGITSNQWNNYAMRVDGQNMEIELFANEVSLGTFDLTDYGLTEIVAESVYVLCLRQQGPTLVGQLPDWRVGRELPSGRSS